MWMLLIGLLNEPIRASDSLILNTFFINIKHYTIQYTLYNIQYTSLYNIQYTLYTTLYNANPSIHHPSPQYPQELNYTSLCMMRSASPPSPANHRLFTPGTGPIYSFDWSPHSAHFCSLAVGSFVTQRPIGPNCHQNQVLLATLSDPKVPEFSSPSNGIQIDYPITKVHFSPHRQGDSQELLGVSGDGLRVYRNHFGVSGNASGHLELIAKLVPAQISTSPTASATASRRPSDANIITSNSTASTAVFPPSRNSPAPITSFDWNCVDSNLLVTSSYDTTCAVWNLDVSAFTLLNGTIDSSFSFRRPVLRRN